MSTILLSTHPVAVPDADDPGVVSAAVVERVDPNLAAAAAAAAEAASLESIAPLAEEAAGAAAWAIRISCFGKERRKWISLSGWFVRAQRWPCIRMADFLFVGTS